MRPVATGRRPPPAPRDPAERFRAAWTEAGEALMAYVADKTRPAPDPDRPRGVDVLEAARLLGVKRSMLYAMLDRGELRSYSIGRRRLVSRASIDELVDALVSAGADEDAAGELTPAAPEDRSRRAGSTPRRPRSG
jgi:excisionase family DNA binding protein